MKSETDKSKQKETSEFGDGLVYNLVMFAKHFERNTLDVYKKSGLPVRMAVEMWANGATDHLYGMKYPKKWKGTVLAKKIDKLVDEGLRMGHGFTGKEYTEQDMMDLQRLTLDIAMMIDEKIGIESIKAEFE